MRLLVHFALRFLNFRMPEFLTLLEMYGLSDYQLYDSASVDLTSPFLELNTPDGMTDEEFVRRIMELASRASLIKTIYELWADAPSLEGLATSLGQLDYDFVHGFSNESTTWCLTVEGIGHTYNLTQQAEVSFLGFQGRVRLSDPDQTYLVLIEHPVLNSHTNDITMSGDHSLEQMYECAKLKASAPVLTEEQMAIPKVWYFCRKLCDSGRSAVALHDLSKRRYLATTSMNHELALIMANMARIQRGSLVLDPFVGSGSILVACAHYGAFCVGTDIDVRAVKNRHKTTNIFASFQQYNYALPEILLADNAIYERLWRTGEMYDAIVSDPPYGIREAARKLGSNKEDRAPIQPEHRPTHVPPTVVYDTAELLTDFLDISARILRPQGRLVYWLAATYDVTAEDIPMHPCLDLVAMTEQQLSTRHGRLLITMQKNRSYDETMAASIRAQVAENVDRSYTNLRKKLHATEDSEANMTIKMSKRVARRKLWAKMKKESADGVTFVQPPSKHVTGIVLDPPSINGKESNDELKQEEES